MITISRGREVGAAQEAGLQVGSSSSKHCMQTPSPLKFNHIIAYQTIYSILVFLKREHQQWLIDGSRVVWGSIRRGPVAASFSKFRPVSSKIFGKVGGRRKRGRSMSPAAAATRRVGAGDRDEGGKRKKITNSGRLFRVESSWYCFDYGRSSHLKL